MAQGVVEQVAAATDAGAPVHVQQRQIGGQAERDTALPKRSRMLLHQRIQIDVLALQRLAAAGRRSLSSGSAIRSRICARSRSKAWRSGPSATKDSALYETGPCQRRAQLRG